MPRSSQEASRTIRRDPSRDEGDASLQVMISKELKRQIAVRAAHEGTTVRTIVLLGLRHAGFDMPDEMLCDRRKTRSAGG